MTAAKPFPSYKEVFDAIPKERMPYFWARQILARPPDEHGIEPLRCIDLAVELQDKGELSPPLSGSVETLARRASGFLKQEVTLDEPMRVDWAAAGLILELLVDHDYRTSAHEVTIE